MRVSPVVRHLFAVLVPALAGMGASFASAAGALSSGGAHPKIFSYPTPYYDEGRLMGGVSALSLSQVTDRAFVSSRFDGLVFMVPWSILEPEPGAIRYDILDRVLAFWSAHGKTVILNIAPMGFPMEIGADWGGKPGRLKGWTPDWVMKTCETREYANTRLLYVRHEVAGPARLPVPWDKAFEERYAAFIAALGRRYDGDPRIECMRVGTGMMGEEHPLYAKGAKYVFAGYTDSLWFGYVKAMLAAHVAAFHKSPLELDMSWAGIPYLKEPGRKEVESVLDAMAQARVILGFNGWGGTPLDQMRTAQHSGMGEILRAYHRRGLPVALEVGGPPAARTNHRMQGTETMLDWCRELHPVHVNFFGQTPAVVEPSSPESSLPEAEAASLAGYRRMCRGAGVDPDALADKYRSLIEAIRELPADAAPGGASHTACVSRGVDPSAAESQGRPSTF